MRKTNKSKPCLDCERRHEGCHDRCVEYQATKRQYAEDIDQTSAYFSDKYTRMKRIYGFKYGRKSGGYG